MKKLILSEFIILLIGMLFAWSNFSLEVYNFLRQQTCSFGCTQGRLVNPVYTPCFYGAIFFTIAFIISAMLLKKSRKQI